MKKLIFFKRGTASLATFSLILSLLFVIFVFSYLFQSELKQNIEIENKKLEQLNSALSFRSQVIQLINLNESSTITYSNLLDPSDMKLYLGNSEITAISENDIFNSINISVFGINFCDSYNFTPKFEEEFLFNGSCIKMITT